MSELDNLNELSEKKIRNLKMKLNNRISAFKLSDTAKELQKSHVLYGLGVEECRSLLERVKQAEAKIKKGQY